MTHDRDFVDLTGGLCYHLREIKVNRKPTAYLLAGASAGLLSGFLGVGGGIILVPMLVGFLGLTQHDAHGTSLAVIIPIALTGAIVYSLRGDMDWRLAATIAPSSMLGASIGAKLMMKASAERLRQIFGVYTVAIAVLLLLK